MCYKKNSKPLKKKLVPNLFYLKKNAYFQNTIFSLYFKYDYKT